MDGTMTRPPTGLTIHRGASLDRADAWAAMTDDERHVRATRAASERDAESLWDLTAVWLVLRGRAGARLSPHTRAAYRQGLTALLLAWRAVDLLHPARDAGALWLRHMESMGLSPSTIRTRRAAARAFYAALRWAGAVELDPFADTHPATDPTPAWEKRQPYTAAEVEALLAAAAPADRALILLAAHGGLRVSECLALRWEDVALVSGTLVVRAGKGGKQRHVSLSRTAVAALGSLRDAPARGGADRAREHVIPYRSDERARERLAVLCATVGVEYKGMHAFRHYCGTRLVGEGGDLEMAARHLGHASIETTRIYVKWNDQGLKKAVGEW
jgi:integrase